MGSDQRDHDAKLTRVLRVLEEKGLTAEWEKCHLGMASVTYLGHEIGERGVTPKKENVKAICDAPPPASKEEVRSFLGMAEYYSKFIQHFASKTHYMRMLTREKTAFAWSEETQREFEGVKKDVTQAIPSEGMTHKDGQ
ncbi:uncharacterized protein LOC144762982 [Lissotriton helveticus]